MVFILSYFNWTYGHPSAGPSAKLPRPACLLPREQVQNSSFRELPRSRFFYDFSRSASAVTRGASAKAFYGGCMEMYCLYLLVSKHCGAMFLVVLAGESGAHIKVMHSDFEFHRWQIHVTFLDG